WDDNKEFSYAMRCKEDARDYRYFPDPDLPPVVISDEWIRSIRDRQPELRTEKMARYKEEFKLSEYDADIITGSKHMADIFEAVTAICHKPKEAANWLMVEAMRLLKEHDIDPEKMTFSAENLAKLIDLVDNGTINRTVGKEVFEKIFAENIDPEQYVEENGLKVVNDEGELRRVIEGIVSANPQSVEDYHSGKEKAFGFLVGQTMRSMKGKADPGAVNRMLKELLG
ncbi:MAG TPA: Asp-tRNA(Asn)/Glu-tRNA(Gln) amidotransferase GatCAB subunit B, partial [Lachnoclostridium sp.]|nr:Asp-tRNA(Asn)/Glu-tRNA(Gln) amidotransferase GatCAB subunit B [Lachnoclostridium sp.]